MYIIYYICIKLGRLKTFVAFKELIRFLSVKRESKTLKLIQLNYKLKIVKTKL